MDNSRASLTEAFYGISKMTTQEKNQRTQARVGLASNIVGIGAGVAGTAAAFKSPALRRATLDHAGPITGAVARKFKLRPKTQAGLIRTGAGAALGLQVANVAGDAVANRVLSRSASGEKKPKKPHIHKSEQMTKLKVKALDSAETQVRQKAPAAAKAVKSGAQAAKNTWTAEAKVSKALEDKRQVYGWASITEIDGQPVVDLQGDYVTIEEIEKAAHKYITSSRKGGDMHRRNGDAPHHVGDLIESVVITQEKKEALGLPPESPTGWWVGFQVNDEETWNLVKDGKRPMFSIHGSGRRVDTEIDA